MQIRKSSQSQDEKHHCESHAESNFFTIQTLWDFWSGKCQTDRMYFKKTSSIDVTKMTYAFLMFKLTAQRKHFVECCNGIACRVGGKCAHKILEAVTGGTFRRRGFSDELVDLVNDTKWQILLNMTCPELETKLTLIINKDISSKKRICSDIIKRHKPKENRQFPSIQDNNLRKK